MHGNGMYFESVAGFLLICGPPYYQQISKVAEPLPYHNSVLIMLYDRSVDDSVLFCKLHGFHCDIRSSLERTLSLSEMTSI